MAPKLIQKLFDRHVMFGVFACAQSQSMPRDAEVNVLNEQHRRLFLRSVLVFTLRYSLDSHEEKKKY
jgi:hypothetical protein